MCRSGIPTAQHAIPKAQQRSRGTRSTIECLAILLLRLVEPPEVIELVGSGKQRKGHFGIRGRGVPKVFERAHAVAAAPGTEPEPKRRTVILRRSVEKRSILPFGAIDVAGFAQFIADRQRDKHVVGIAFGSPPKGCKRTGSGAPVWRAQA